MQNKNEQNTNTDVAVQPKNENIVVHQQTTNNGLVAIDMDFESIPNLDDAQVIPIDLSSIYWTPEFKDEKKRMFFDKIEIRLISDKENPEVVTELPVAFFYEKVGIEVKTICNASKRLIAVLENNKIQRGTPLEIIYLGKKKNSTNEFKSDSWSIKPLIIKSK